MEKELFEGMVSTLTELASDAQQTAELAREGQFNIEDFAGITAELSSWIVILANTLSVYAVTNEAAKVLLAEEE